jgi:hypothetical protein
MGAGLPASFVLAVVAGPEYTVELAAEPVEAAAVAVVAAVEFVAVVAESAEVVVDYC